MSERTTLEVLIVSFNSRGYLKECLASLRRYAVSDANVQVTVRVFDNASTDGSADLVAATFPDIDVIRSDHNVGFATANNRLVASSEADMVMLLNPDTVLTGALVAPLVDALGSDTRVAVAGPRLVYPDGSAQPSAQRLPTLRLELATSLHATKADRVLRSLIDLSATIDDAHASGRACVSQPQAVDFLWATCWLMRAVDARRFGPFDEQFTTYDEDLDLCRRLADAGRLVVYVPTTELIHVGGASSDPARKLRLMRAGRERYYRRHSGVCAALAYRAIITGADASKAFLRALRRS